MGSGWGEVACIDGVGRARGAVLCINSANQMHRRQSKRRQNCRFCPTFRKCPLFSVISDQMYFSDPSKSGMTLFTCNLQVQVDYYTDGASVMFYLFSNDGDSKTAWFSKETLIASTYTNLQDALTMSVEG